jgi:hypothetical protein
MSRAARLLIRYAPMHIALIVVMTVVTLTGLGLAEYLFWLGGYAFGLIDMAWDQYRQEADRQAALRDDSLTAVASSWEERR